MSHGSDAEFEIVQRAVERGLLQVGDVEEAIRRREKDPGKRLLELLPLGADQVKELRGAHPRPVPPEASAAAEDPANRFGHYVSVRKISEGGMGEVRLAWDTRLARWVALKLPRLAGDDRARAYFAREATLAAGLDHPNIAKIYEVGERDGAPFMTLQFIDGRTLDRAAKGEPLEKSARWARDVASAVAAAHHGGVIHRDLKPGNVMVDGEGRVFVLDFGLAKETDAGAETLGNSRFTAGTPGYMAPEQARGEAIPASDVYGIGAILYELATGRPPFVGKTSAEIMLQVMRDEPVRPRRLNPGVPPDLEAIILTCLEKETSRRFASASALVEDLEAFVEGRPLRHARRPTWPYVLAKRIRRQPLLWGTAAAATLLVAALAATGIAWATRPGVLRVSSSVPGARIRVGEKRFTLDAGTVVLSLPPGAVEIRAEASGCEPETRVVALKRGEAREITFALRHEQGLLEIHAQPPDAAVDVEGTTYGSTIYRLALDTGRQTAVARAAGCFERAVSVDIAHDATSRLDLSLDPGELWRYRSDRIQSSAETVAFPDVDGDGVEDLALEELRDLVVLSGTDGRELLREPVSDDAAWNFDCFDLGGAPRLVAWTERKDGLRVVALDPWRRAKPWTWSGPAEPNQPTRSSALCVPEGSREIVAGAAGGCAFVLDPDTGTAREIRFEHPDFHLLRLVPAGPGVVAFIGWRGAYESSTPVRTGAFRLSDGSAAWSSPDPAVSVSSHADFLGKGSPQAVVVFPSSWSVLDFRSGEAVRAGPLPAGSRLLGELQCGDSGLLLFRNPSGGLRAVRIRDGSTAWTSPEAAGQGYPCVLSGSGVLVQDRESYSLLDASTGRALWSRPGRVEGAIRADLDRDGVPETIVGEAGVGLACLDDEGRARWTLRLKGDARPICVSDAGSDPRVVFGRGSAFVGVARSPRILWTADSVAPLLAAPRVAAGRVVQAGDWGSGVATRAFDAATGAPAWDCREFSPPNNAPAVADWDGDGVPDLVQWFGADGSAGQRFAVFRAADGKRLAELPLPGNSDAYASPTVADLNGDGRPDAFMNRRGARDAVAVDGRTGKVLWTVPLGGDSWGGAAAADVDGDGVADLVVPASGQPLRALRGRDGMSLWTADAGEAGVLSAPLAADLDGDGRPEILATGADGVLRALRARDGRLLWQFAAGSAASSLCALRSGDSAVILVSGGAGGVSALDASGRILWTSATPSNASPALADLDHDGAAEAIVAASDGRLLVLDARTGRRLWDARVSTQGIDAAPSVADLDGDGTLDVLVADKAGRLTAVSGRPTAAARR